jgi:adenosylcobinamide-GDP ribazoletransferase
VSDDQADARPSRETTRPEGALARLETALRGALAFLTRLPVESDERAFETFRATPAAFVLAGYVVGLLAAVPFLLDLPATAAAAAYLVVLYLVTGVNHADGLADLGDALAVHGDPERRREVLKDTTTGVGALLALGVGLAALALGALGVAGFPTVVAFGIVLAAELAAKLAMATVAAFGTASHDGFGAGFTREVEPGLLVGPVVFALPVLVLVPLGGLAALASGLLVGWGLTRWADASLGGVNGDVFGTANELARVAALHVGVVVWFL